MTLRRHAARRDDSETEIVACLQRMGFHVERLSARGLPDLLLSRAGKWYVAEIKSPRGKPTAEQESFAARARAPVPILRTVEDALEFSGWR